MPDFSLENATDGPVCGIDEVGRGPLAGPVVAACVYIPEDKYDLDFIGGIKDSKALTKKKREEVFPLIREHCVFGIAEIPPQDIDEINILQASLKAMERAFQSMFLPFSPSPSPLRGSSLSPMGRGWPNEERTGEGVDNITALIDGHIAPPNMPCPVQTIIKGDTLSISIAAASILAKVTRDQLMTELHAQHPHYGWETNAGYGTKEHVEAIARHGITDHHRKSFAPVRMYVERKYG